MTSEENNDTREMYLTEDEELIVHNSEQMFGERPKMKSTQNILKRQQFEYWEEMFIELDGNPDTLKILKRNFEENVNKYHVTKLCVPIVNEIKKLPDGEGNVFEFYIEKDRMECTHEKVADIFNHITQGSYIRKQTKPDAKGKPVVLIYKYNSETQLWDQTADLKTHFINVMKLYRAILCQKRVNDIPLNKEIFEEHYTEKDKDEKGIYLKRQKIYCNFMENNSHINAIIDIFKSIVTVEDTLFDLAPEYDKYISFKNGIYDLDTSVFRRRDISDRFTLSLDWDYGKHYNIAIFDDIHEFFNKIQPKQEQKTFTVSFLKYCLRGGNPQALFKMNVGHTAANGKTTEMDIHERAFPLYTDKLDRTIFSKTCTKRHKYAYKLVTSPIRLAYINELDDTKLDEDVLKDFSDGKNMPLEELFNTMCSSTRIQCKLITTSNKDPNLVPDGGIIRRAIIQQYTSRFVSQDAVDSENHKYLLDPTWVDTRFSQDAYKLAYFHFLLKEGRASPVIVPETNLRLVTETLNENDDFLPQLEQHFVITREPTDKVSYLDIQRTFPNMQVRVLNGHLKRLGITYDKNGSTHSIRKVYRGIRKYTQNETDELENDSNLEIEDPE